MSAERRELLRAFVAQKVREVNGSEFALADGDSLLLSGLLNSLTIVEIIMFVELEFGLDITADGVQIEDFDSIDSISALLDRHGSLVGHDD